MTEADYIRSLMETDEEMADFFRQYSGLVIQTYIRRSKSSSNKQQPSRADFLKYLKQTHRDA